MIAVVVNEEILILLDSVTDITFLLLVGLETDVNGGFQATCASSPNIVTVGNCFYCRGCVLLAVENYKGKQSLSALTTQSIGGEEEADQLLTIFEDSVIQRSNTMMLQVFLPI